MREGLLYQKKEENEVKRLKKYHAVLLNEDFSFNFVF